MKSPEMTQNSSKLAQISQFFSQTDPKLYQYLTKVPDLTSLPSYTPENYFARLCRSIIYQQLSGKAAGTIYSRYEQLFDKQPINPTELLKIPHEELRSAGLSNAKAQYVRNIANAAIDGTIQFEQLDNHEDQYIIDHLTQIKGVGRWTAEMFLMFTMGREDIFSIGDLGLRKGFTKVYGYKREPSSRTLLQKSAKWSPYRSYASLALWNAVDN